MTSCDTTTARHTTTLQHTADTNANCTRSLAASLLHSATLTLTVFSAMLVIEEHLLCYLANRIAGRVAASPPTASTTVTRRKICVHLPGWSASTTRCAGGVWRCRQLQLQRWSITVTVQLTSIRLVVRKSVDDKPAALHTIR